MKVIVQNYEKFNYVVIDDFFEQNDFNEITKVELENLENEEIKVYDKFNKELKDRIYFKHNEQLISILGKLAPKKIKLKRRFDIRLAQTGPDATYPVHQDHPNKILSVVVYISPSVSTGTLLHSSEMDEKPKEIQWKSNRAFIFSRHPNNTWHSYVGDKKTFRRTIVYNIYTDDIFWHELIDKGYFGFVVDKLKQLKNRFKIKYGA